MKNIIPPSLILALLLGCSDGTERQVAAPTHTILERDTIYYYKSAFPEFVERLEWIAKTDRDELVSAERKKRDERRRTKDTLIPLLFGDFIGAGIEYMGWLRNEDGERRAPFWLDPVGHITDAPFENQFERVSRSLPKLAGDGEWNVVAIEELRYTLDDPAKEIFSALAEYGSQGPRKAIEAQPQIKVVAHSSALVFRQSDNTVIFVVGIKWNHPMYSDGYTEFHMTVSQVTGAVVTESFAYTTFPLEPREWSQYHTIATTAANAIRIASRLLSGI